MVTIRNRKGIRLSFYFLRTKIFGFDAYTPETCPVLTAYLYVKTISLTLSTFNAVP